MPGKGSHWQSPPLGPELGAAPAVGSRSLADPGAELRLFSLLGLALPGCFSAGCVTGWLLAPRHPGARLPPGQWWVLPRPALLQGGGGGRAAPLQSPPSPTEPAVSGDTQSLLRGVDGTASRGAPGWAPTPGYPNRAPCSGTRSCFWHLGCIPGDEPRDGKGLPHSTQLRNLQHRLLEGPVLCRVPGMAQPR